MTQSEEDKIIGYNSFRQKADQGSLETAKKLFRRGKFQGRDTKRALNYFGQRYLETEDRDGQRESQRSNLTQTLAGLHQQQQIIGEQINEMLSQKAYTEYAKNLPFQDRVTQEKIRKLTSTLGPLNKTLRVANHIPTRDQEFTGRVNTTNVLSGQINRNPVGLDDFQADSKTQGGVLDSSTFDFGKSFSPNLVHVRSMFFHFFLLVFY